MRRKLIRTVLFTLWAEGQRLTMDISRAIRRSSSLVSSMAVSSAGASEGSLGAGVSGSAASLLTYSTLTFSLICPRLVQHSVYRTAHTGIENILSEYEVRHASQSA